MLNTGTWRNWLAQWSYKPKAGGSSPLVPIFKEETNEKNNETNQ